MIDKDMLEEQISPLSCSAIVDVARGNVNSFGKAVGDGGTSIAYFAYAGHVGHHKAVPIPPQAV